MLEFRRLSDQYAQVMALFERAPAYFQLAEGRGPTCEDARQLLDETPPATPPEQKFVWGLEQDGLHGCLDLVRGYPDAETAFLGLLLVAEDRRGLGLGRRAVEFALETARAWQCRRIRLGVLQANTAGLEFWQRFEFVLTGETKGRILLMERPLPWGN
ncbi:MAG: GNAT family N-acetyltransferase [Candidatus Eremiobacteraeota bacterium]|nr:GNAT family N-acetyltransferase [Candidatus Eremiobacteraeota bacterium]